MDTAMPQIVENEWEVLTDDGWSEFSCLKISNTEYFYDITFESGNTIKITEGHKLLTESGWVNAEKLVLGLKVVSKISNEIVSKIEKIPGGKAYDLVGVEKNSRYFTNDIVSHNCDEFAHLAPNLAEEFISSVFPTLSSSQESKLVLVSTPKGFNTFAKIWKEAEEGINGFVPVTGTWDENPTRNQKWADEQLAILGEVKYAQEIETSFVGSSYSLVSGHKIAALATSRPVHEQDRMKFYEQPIKGHSYVMTVDTSRGQHLDYSAFVVFDISTIPYKVVATFKDNTISPESYPYMIYTIAKQYNDAHVLIEVNDLGEMIASNLFYEYEYENTYFTYKDVINEGRGFPGVRTTKKVKSIGCSTLKSLIEQDQLIINSHDILAEMGVFVQKGASYAAEDEEINDDLMTCLWLFAWLTKQALFMELTDTNIRAILSKKTDQYIDENMLPFGFVDDGRNDELPHGQLDISKFGGDGDPFLKWLFS